jgi:hypothetical protein
MSYPYPQDRHRDRQEKGDQPYKDAREALAQQGASMRAQEEAQGDEFRGRMEETEGATRPSEETLELMRQAGDEVRAAREAELEETGGETTPEELADLRHTGTAIGHRGHDEPEELTDQH